MSERKERGGALTLANPVGEATLIASIKRALDVVEAESRALRAGGGTDLKAFEYRKSQALLDLSRARQSVPSAVLGQNSKELLGHLRAALTDNMSLLSKHLSAVKEIADLVAQSMLEADSDGTYARPAPGYFRE